MSHCITSYWFAFLCKETRRNAKGPFENQSKAFFSSEGLVWDSLKCDAVFSSENPENILTFRTRCVIVSIEKARHNNCFV